MDLVPTHESKLSTFQSHPKGLLHPDYLPFLFLFPLPHSQTGSPVALVTRQSPLGKGTGTSVRTPKKGETSFNGLQGLGEV